MAKWLIDGAAIELEQPAWRLFSFGHDNEPLLYPHASSHDHRGDQDDHAAGRRPLSRHAPPLSEITAAAFARRPAPLGTLLPVAIKGRPNWLRAPYQHTIPLLTLEPHHKHSLLICDAFHESHHSPQ